ncbi:putative quinol monooxygenase [Lentisalinibacter sediminis]|uniref:putative quinol monooxygenase n=1 Tax=Lentisalinibacter sediminis TaxID=2992237 RepID=UPI0038666C75
MDRRIFLIGLGLAPIASLAFETRSNQSGGKSMYGLIGQIMTKPDSRDELIAILLAGTKGMPGCLSYVVSKDPSDPDSIWVTEIWKDKKSHTASLSLQSVRDAIEQGKPLIAGFGKRIELSPVGGHGLEP